MDINEFRKNRIKGRKQLFDRIVMVFTSLHPYAIHQFGSGAHGYKDEFSDIDIWITFKDDEIEDVLKNLNSIFKSIAPVLIRHHSRAWSPVGGSSNSVIHDSKFGPFVVDYYISKLSQTVIKTDAIAVFGSDSLPRGEWKLNNEANKDIHDPHTLRKDTDLLIDQIFISIKGIVRKWKDESFVNSIKDFHKKFRRKYNNIIKRRQISLSYKTIYRILADLYKISTKSQRRAISIIRTYAKLVEVLYY